jgi:hypothetical protein
MIKPKIQLLTESQIRFLKGSLSFFEINDKPAFDVLTYSQKVMFYTIIRGDKHRIQIVASTQYGKSLVVSLACLYLSCIEGKLAAVVAPAKEKSKIIMRYYIEHLGDSVYLYQELERDTKLERLRQEESKERIILNNGGGIYVVSAQERNSLKSVESAMGLGAEILIMDEACLINDNTEATIFRMIAGKGDKAMYCKIGNPFYSSEPYSHFRKSWENDRYEKIFINDEIGLAEGRYTKEFLEEAKEKPLYNILFKSEFPDEEEMDKDGYRVLLTSNQIVKGAKPEVFADDYILGIDIGGGGDKSKFIVRNGKFAWVEATLTTTDTMLNVDKALDIVDKYNIKKTKVFVDDTGIGRGVSDMLKQKGFYNCGVSFGATAHRKELFANRRAEMYWDMSDWVKDGGILDENSDGWIELTWTKYKVQTGEKKIILEDKDRVKQKFRASPNTADALALTFYKPKFIGVL